MTEQNGEIIHAEYYTELRRHSCAGCYPGNPTADGSKCVLRAVSHYDDQGVQVSVGTHYEWFATSKPPNMEEHPRLTQLRSGVLSTQDHDGNVVEAWTRNYYMHGGCVGGVWLPANSPGVPWSKSAEDERGGAQVYNSVDYKGSNAWDGCHGNAPDTPCSTSSATPTPCTLGDTQLGEAIGGVAGRRYFCLTESLTYCGGQKSLMIPWEEVTAKRYPLVRESAVVEFCPICSNCWWHGESRRSGGVRYCGSDSLDTAAVSPSMGEPPASWHTSTELDILPSELWPRETRKWGTNRFVRPGAPSTFVMERYLHWTRKPPGGERVGVAVGSLARGRDLYIAGGASVWVASFGYRASECGIGTGSGYTCSGRCTAQGTPTPDGVLMTPIATSTGYPTFTPAP